MAALNSAEFCKGKSSRLLFASPFNLRLPIIFNSSFNADCLRVKLRRVSQQLLGRLPTIATLEERVKAIVSGGINLSSLSGTS